MSTSQRSKHEMTPKQRSIESVKSINPISKVLKAALIGLLMICVTTTSACKSASSLPVEPSQVTVDASLMVPSNYTSQLLEVLSK